MKINDPGEPLLTIPDIEKLNKMMEEMANAPGEEMGKRQPGETCMYERPLRLP